MKTRRRLRKNRRAPAKMPVWRRTTSILSSTPFRLAHRTLSQGSEKQSPRALINHRFKMPSRQAATGIKSPSSRRSLSAMSKSILKLSASRTNVAAITKTCSWLLTTASGSIRRCRRALQVTNRQRLSSNMIHWLSQL